MARADTRRPDPRRQDDRRPGGRPGVDEPDEQDEALEEQPKSRKMLWIILSLSTLLLLGGGGAGAYFFVFSEDDPLGLFGGEARGEQAQQRQPPIYYSMDPAFINNLSGTGGRRFMQVTVQLMARDQAVIAAVQRHEPVVRNDLLMLFSDQTLESVDTTSGKEELRRKSLDAIRRILRSNDEPDALEDLFFTSFIVQ